MGANPIVVPPALTPGARIAVVAPSGPPCRQALARGLDRLRSWGFDPVLGRSVGARLGELAGADAERAFDLNWALTATDIDAVWAARGGWGAARILGQVDWRRARRRPRWVVGFSDLTAVQAVLLDRGVASLYAPVVAELSEARRCSAAELRRALTAPRAGWTLGAVRPTTLVPGRASGPLAGGCLTLLASLVGTPWQPDLGGKIVLFEDVNEAPHRIDRMLWQLRQARALDGAAGFLFGQFVNCRPAAGRPARRLRDIFSEHAAALGRPAFAGAPVGHGRRTRVVALGFTATLDADRGVIRLAPPAVG